RRRKVLEAIKNPQAVRADILEKIEKAVGMIVSIAEADPTITAGTMNEKVLNNFLTIINFDETSRQQVLQQLEQRSADEEKTELLVTLAKDIYQKRVESFGEQVSTQIEQKVTLSVIDTLWMNHLDVMDNLRQGIQLRGYAQRDPLVEYKNEGY